MSGAVSLMMECRAMLADDDGPVNATVITCLSAVGTVSMGITTNFNQERVPFASFAVTENPERPDEGYEGNLTMIGKQGDNPWDLLRRCLDSMTTGPLHKHDCDNCTYIGSYPRRHGGWADVWLTCEQSDYRYIVRYGRYGAYATTNDVTRYVFAPLIGPSLSEYEMERNRPIRLPDPSAIRLLNDPEDVPDLLDDLPDDIFSVRDDL